MVECGMMSGPVLAWDSEELTYLYERPNGVFY